MPNLQRGTAQCSFDLGETYGEITPAIDVANFNMPISDCIVANKGNMFTLGSTEGSLLVNFAVNCQARIGGAYFILKSSASITLEPNATQYICLNINKGNQDGSKADIVLKTLSQIKKEDLYGAGSERDLPIYKVITNATGISSQEDLRKIVGNTYLVSETEYDNITTKETYAIYDIVED